MSPVEPISDAMSVTEFNAWRSQFPDLNLPQMAALLGVKESTVWRWEQGQRNVGAATLLRARFRELLQLRNGLVTEFTVAEAPTYAAAHPHLDLRPIADDRRPLLRRAAHQSQPSGPSA